MATQLKQKGRWEEAVAERSRGMQDEGSGSSLAINQNPNIPGAVVQVDGDHEPASGADERKDDGQPGDQSEDEFEDASDHLMEDDGHEQGHAEDRNSTSVQMDDEQEQLMQLDDSIVGSNYSDKFHCADALSR